MKKTGRGWMTNVGWAVVVNGPYCGWYMEPTP